MPTDGVSQWTFLIATTDAALYGGLVSILSCERYVLHKESSLDGTVSRLSPGVPDLLILDFRLYRTDPVGWHGMLHSRSGRDGLPIPFVLVADGKGVAERAALLGALDVLPRRFNRTFLPGRIACLLALTRRLREQKENEAFLLRALDRPRPDNSLPLLKEAIDCLPIGITITDIEGKIVYANPAEAELHGMTMAELQGRGAGELAPVRLRRSLLQKEMNDLGLWRRESINTRRNGDEFPVQLTSIAVRDEDRCIGIITACEDISDRKEAEKRIAYLAYYDTLTELPNRWMFQDRLHQTLALASRHGHQVGLLFLDLDNFKDINDTLGHDLGDKLLRSVGKRLAGCIRESDTLARIGGDEFVVMVTGLAGHESAAQAAQRVLSQFVRPFMLDGHEVYTSPSIGIALYPDDAVDADGLLKCADTAMYHAKNEGRQNYSFFTSDLNYSIMRRVAIENGLREGIENGEFFMVYQPQVDVKTLRIVGVEALIRWQSSSFGLLTPSEFIPVAEKSGLIFAIGAWALRTACRQAKAWADQGLSGLRLAVNISAQQFRQLNFLPTVVSILEETGLDPHLLELEVTESVLMEHAEQNTAILKALKSRGIRLSIDDFGTGYSSLSYLKHFPIDRLKIDRSFLAGVTSSSDDAAIVAAILLLARSLKLTVVAEGVETLEQLEFLAARGCDEVQGFYLAMPMLAEEIPACLTQDAFSPSGVAAGFTGLPLSTLPQSAVPLTPKPFPTGPAAARV